MGQTFFSLEFLIFLAVVVAVTMTIARKRQWPFLLAASYAFYALNTRWEFVLLLGAVTGVNFLLANLIRTRQLPRSRRTALWLGIAFNAGLLLGFKWLRFSGSSGALASSGHDLVRASAWVPLGVSYFSFKAISYVIDVYRGKAPSEAPFGKLALYLSFFPEICAGPIGRAREFFAQIRMSGAWADQNVTDGLRLVLWGYFKKFVIANNLAVYVNQVYGAPTEFPGPILVVVTYFLAFQIYADFSGYTDIALGIGRILGYQLPRNFRSPYFSRSIGEFWTRWHMTLSSWLRDYLFLPLSFFLSRRIRGATVIRIESEVVIYASSALITFLIAGVWHGSAWTFVAWGLLHGLYLSLSNATRRLRKRIRKALPLARRFPRITSALQTVLCFHLVVLSWVFFRASSMKDALAVIRNIVPRDLASFMSGFLNPRLPWRLEGSKYGFVFSGLAVLFLILAEWRMKDREIPRFFEARRRPVRWLAYYVVLFSIFLFGEFAMKEFLYVQF